MKKERIYIFDFLRIFSMYLVIVIHIANIYMRTYPNLSIVSFITSNIFDSFARISVPIFFMISGALLIHGENNIEKYKARIIKFITILIFWNVFYFIWNSLYLGKNYNFIKTFFKSFFEPTRSHLWFMYPIIGIYIALPFIRKMVQNLNKREENLFIILWLGFSTMVYPIEYTIKMFMKIELDVVYPVPIIQGTYYLGYFILGYILVNRFKEVGVEILSKYRNRAIYTIIFSNIITILYVHFRSTYVGYYADGMYAYRSIFIVLSSISAFLLFYLYQGKIVTQKNLKYVKHLSKYAFGVYLLHPIYLDLLEDLINLKYVWPIISIPLFSIIIYIITYATIYILGKSKYLARFLF